VIKSGSIVAPVALALAVVLALLPLVAADASAQGLEPGSWLPRMPALACGSLENARKQATLSHRHGRQSLNVNERRPIHAPCHAISAKLFIVGQETLILPFASWEPSFDPDPKAAKLPVETDSGEIIEIGYKVIRQTVRYYNANYEHRDGKVYGVYVELPDEPLVVKYLEWCRTQQACPKESGTRRRPRSRAGQFWYTVSSE
jgi:hypothetical protein